MPQQEQQQFGCHQKQQQSTNCSTYHSLDQYADFSKHKSWDLLKGADVIIIDEVSLLTSDLLSAIAHRIHEVESDDNVAVHGIFAQKLLILVGDLFQLPPVCKRHRRQPFCKQCHLSNNFIFQAAVHCNLTFNVRHAADPRIHLYQDWSTFTKLDRLNFVVMLLFRSEHSRLLCRKANDYHLHKLRGCRFLKQQNSEGSAH